MQKRAKRIGQLWPMLILIACCLAPGSENAAAEPKGDDTPGRFSGHEWKVFIEEHEPLLDRALDAYNREDYGGFVKNFSDRRRKLSERAFRALWSREYKQLYGNYISKEFFPEKSNPDRMYPLMTYRAEFSGNDETALRCIFAEDEDGVYRIFYLRIDPYEDLFY